MILQQTKRTYYLYTVYTPSEIKCVNTGILWLTVLYIYWLWKNNPSNWRERERERERARERERDFMWNKISVKVENYDPNKRGR